MALTLRELFTRFPYATEIRLPDLDRTVSDVVPIAMLTVKSSEVHCTLVTGSESEILAAISAADSRKLGLFQQSVIVSADNTPRLCSAIEHAQIPAALGITPPAPNLTTVLTSALTDRQADDDRLLATAARVLTKVAHSGGIIGVLSQLSDLLDGWAVLLDAHGQVIQSVGAGRLHIDDAVAVVTNRPVRVRYPGLQVHVVDSAGGTSNRLVVASRISSAYRARSVAALSASIIGLMLTRNDPSETERIGRKVMVESLVSGGPAVRTLLEDWNLREHELGAFIVAARTRDFDVEELVSRWFNDKGFPHLFSGSETEVHGFASSTMLKYLEERVDGFTSHRNERLHLGIGNLTTTDSLALSARQAREALAVAASGGSPSNVIKFDEISSLRHTVLQLSDGQRESLSGILTPLLLAGDESEELLAVLYEFLRANGAWSETSKILGIHRQTLAKRIEHIEKLLDVTMHSPDDRATLWLALRNHQLFYPKGSSAVERAR